MTLLLLFGLVGTLLLAVNVARPRRRTRGFGAIPFRRYHNVDRAGRATISLGLAFAAAHAAGPLVTESVSITYGAVALVAILFGLWPYTFGIIIGMYGLAKGLFELFAGTACGGLLDASWRCRPRMRWHDASAS